MMTSKSNGSLKKHFSFAILMLMLLRPINVSRGIHLQKTEARRVSAPPHIIYASPSGNDKNSGVTRLSPKTFLGAAAVAKAGAVVCLLEGTYSLQSSFIPPLSGKPDAWIVYKSCDEGPVRIVWTGPADGSPMFKLGTGRFPSGPAYLEFRGLHLDGNGNASDGFFCRGGHHLRFVDNSITNTGGSGIGSIMCDYLTADHNFIYHNGYIPKSTKVPQWYSWTSGISFNSDQWFDSYPGFHNIISNNIVIGEVDQSPKHTDGNGIILDLSNRTYDLSSANTPPALVVNNVVYANGGRCIEAFTVTNFWFVNNTCYRNNLDPALASEGSIVINDSLHGYVINNIVVSSQAKSAPLSQEKFTADIKYFSDMYYGAQNDFDYSEQSQLVLSAPFFADSPVMGLFDPVRSAPDQIRAELRKQLSLKRSSPAIAKGIDPSTLPKLNPFIRSDLKKYIYWDIDGHPRPKGGPFDLGAYQSSSGR